MWFAPAFRIAGVLLMFFSLSMLPPALISLLYNDGLHTFFLLVMCALSFAGFLVWFPLRHSVRELRPRDGFMVTVLIYIVLGLAGAVPLYFSGYVPTYQDAIFESLSGLTTTGATVLTGLDSMPAALLFYRQQLQWFGGMGIIMLAVAVLPMLGIGGVQLYRAEVQSLDKERKLQPRIAKTAQVLWLIYLVLTIFCAIAYSLAGMSWFDAICHSFSTVSIGGFSTHDASIAWFNSRAVETVGIIFMIICATNFGLHFAAWRSRSFRQYLQDGELKFFLGLLGLGILVSVLAVQGTMGDSWMDSAASTVFQTVSIATTTGFTLSEVDKWPTFVPLLMFLMAFIGGCSGSSAGGLKALRFMVILLQSMREITRLIHPHAIYHIKVGKFVVEDKIIHAAWGLLTAMVFMLAIMILLLMWQGLDFLSAFSAVLACLTNLGPGLGEVASHYAGTTVIVKWVLCLAMLMGRLEIFAVLTLFMPSFWR